VEPLFQIYGGDMLQPFYRKSWALIVGVDHYQHVSPLTYACNDADAVAEILVDELNFPAEHVIVLKNEEATREAILENYLDFIHKADDSNDRVMFFFAGHGHTIESQNGPVGYLLPFDANMSRFNTLIRWDELTRNADMIPSKHMLFVIDACYSGLAIQRVVPPGTKRFLNSMLQRRARQVITAGKADETVADGGGPGGKNSIFTGYLLQGLKGDALDENRVLTAMGLMNYVYRKVGQDNRSRQTPAYGYLDGDGDFIFRIPHELDLYSPPQSDILLKPAVEMLEAIPAFSQVQPVRPSFAVANGYQDPRHPNFGRNNWSEKLGEWRGSRSTSRQIVRAFSWLSVMMEPTSSQNLTIDIAQESERLNKYKATGSKPYERFWFHGNRLTTVNSVVLHQEEGADRNYWGYYLRIDQHGNIEYADAVRVFYEWENMRWFKYVPVIGLIWQFMFFAKQTLANVGYDLGAELVVNLVGTEGTMLSDFAQEPGEDNQRWAQPNSTDLFMERRKSMECHDLNIQLKYQVILGNLDEDSSFKIVEDIGRKLGLAYNHQSVPRCFNYNTNNFPWNQFSSAV
jgi:hypothetical protein